MMTVNGRFWFTQRCLAVAVTLFVISMILVWGHLRVRKGELANPFALSNGHSATTSTSSDGSTSEYHQQQLGLEAELEREQFLAHNFDWETTSSFSPVRQAVAENTTVADLCASFPRARLQHDLQPVLKIGFTESRARVEAQFASVSACFTPDELLVVSDRDEVLEGSDKLVTGRKHLAVDVLNDLPDAYFDDNPALANYTLVRDAWNAGKIDELRDEMGGSLPEIRGWDLDKYKFLPMIQRAWMTRPGRKWYMFYESDTYVVWDNVFRLIDHMDANTPLYMGAATPGRDGTVFGYGGAGFLLSRAAMEKLLDPDKNDSWKARKEKGLAAGVGASGDLTMGSLAAAWLDDSLRDCCGDSIVGWAMHENGMKLSNLHPMFGAASLSTLVLGNKHWCQPILTMHRTSPENSIKLWRWEHEMRTNRKPLLYKDFFDFHHARNPDAVLIDWDNAGREDPYFAELEHIESLDACERACEAEGDCIQYRWHGRRCRLMATARYGTPRGPEGMPAPKEDKEKQKGGSSAAGMEEEEPWTEEEKQFMSGWNRERILNLGEKECKMVEWRRSERVI